MPLSGSTNRVKKKENDWVYRGVALPTNFFVALVIKGTEKNPNAAAAVDKTGGLTGIPITAHGFATGAQVNVEGTTNYNGAYLVDAASTVNELVIKATFVSETFSVTDTVHLMPGPDTNILSDLTEIPAGNGYTAGGFILSKNTTDFDSSVEDDTNDRGDLQIKDVVYMASGGPIPASGPGARYAVLTDDNATVANREVYYYWDLGAERTVSDTQPLTLVNLEIRKQEQEAA